MSLDKTTGILLGVGGTVLAQRMSKKGRRKKTERVEHKHEMKSRQALAKKQYAKAKAELKQAKRGR